MLTWRFVALIEGGDGDELSAAEGGMASVQSRAQDVHVWIEMVLFQREVGVHASPARSDVPPKLSTTFDHNRRNARSRAIWKK